jgi:hypothetical protein
MSIESSHLTAAGLDSHDGLKGFEIKDPDGYVLFFGRPRQAADGVGR